MKRAILYAAILLVPALLVPGVPAHVTWGFAALAAAIALATLAVASDGGNTLPPPVSEAVTGITLLVELLMIAGIRALAAGETVPDAFVRLHLALSLPGSPIALSDLPPGLAELHAGMLALAFGLTLVVAAGLWLTGWPGEDAAWGEAWLERRRAEAIRQGHGRLVGFSVVGNLAFAFGGLYLPAVGAMIASSGEFIPGFPPALMAVLLVTMSAACLSIYLLWAVAIPLIRRASRRQAARATPA